MVTTRSGLKLRRHDVRFKRGATVRRILDYDDSQYDFEVNNQPLTAALTHTTQQSPLRGILSHSTAKTAQLNGHATISNQSSNPLPLTSHAKSPNGFAPSNLRISVSNPDDNTDIPVQDNIVGLNDTEKSVLYDVCSEDRPKSTVVWDTLLFLTIAAVGVFTAYHAYNILGYRLYTLLISLFITVFTYNVAYFDSEQPGIMPPSPISPAKYRRMSGHSYHLAYVMCIVNAVVFLVAEHLMTDTSVPAL